MPEILFLAHRIPFPPNRGDKIRSFNILKHLARHMRVHLACFADNAGELEQVHRLRQALGGALGEIHIEVRRGRPFKAATALFRGRPLSTALFASDTTQAFVDGILAGRPLDAVFAFSGQMAQFVPAHLSCRFVMDFVDVDSAKFDAFGAQGRGPLAWVHRREGKRLRDFERAVARRADSSLFVSEAEAALFRSRSGLTSADIRALGNGIDLAFYDPAAPLPPLPADARGKGPMIVFTGQMDYRPNVEAVTSFGQAAMPRIRSKFPEARFAVVGRNPTSAVAKLDGCNGTAVIGAVDDVRSWLAAADVVVAPLTIARGIQNKVLEAMAMGRPVVASRAAFEGIEAAAGQDLLLADTPAEQADAVIRLLREPATASALGAAARLRMEQAYGWEGRLAPILALLGLPARREAA